MFKVECCFAVQRGYVFFKVLMSSKVTFITTVQIFLYLLCVQAEIILQGTMYLSPDVGSRAPRGLAWGLSTREQDRESLVTVLVAYSNRPRKSSYLWM